MPTKKYLAVLAKLALCVSPPGETSTEVHNYREGSTDYTVMCFKEHCCALVTVSHRRKIPLRHVLQEVIGYCIGWKGIADILLWEVDENFVGPTDRSFRKGGESPWIHVVLSHLVGALPEASFVDGAVHFKSSGAGDGCLDSICKVLANPMEMMERHMFTGTWMRSVTRIMSLYGKMVSQSTYVINYLYVYEGMTVKRAPHHFHSHQIDIPLGSDVHTKITDLDRWPLSPSPFGAETITMLDGTDASILRVAKMVPGRILVRRPVPGLSKAWVFPELFDAIKEKVDRRLDDHYHGEYL